MSRNIILALLALLFLDLTLGSKAYTSKVLLKGSDRFAEGLRRLRRSWCVHARRRKWTSALSRDPEFP